MALKVEKVEFKEEKPKLNKIDTLIGFLTLFLLISGYLSIWLEGIWFKIFLTILLTQLVFIGGRKK